MCTPTFLRAITRAVQLYITSDRHEDALNAIGRLSEAERFLAYRLTAITYGSREGSANLFKLLSRVIEKEKPSGPVDNILQQIAKVIAKKGRADESKALDTIAQKYPRLRRWAHFSLCEIHKREDSDRLLKFIGDYRTGGVETTQVWGRPESVRQEFRRLRSQ